LDAISHCVTLNAGGRKGWHLPTVEQLTSLVDPTISNPSLPSGHPFLNVQSLYYWSATNFADGTTTSAWVVYFGSDSVTPFGKATDLPAWCVRGGQSL